MNSKFERVPGKMGWFKLKNYYSTQTPPPLLPLVDEGQYYNSAIYSGRGLYHVYVCTSYIVDQLFQPKAVIVKSGTSNHKRSRCSSSSSSGSGSEGSSSSGEDSSSSTDDDLLYHKKYSYLKGMAKRLILVCN